MPMRHILGLVATLALTTPAAAEISGCWRDSDPAFLSTVCFEQGSGGTFAMTWDANASGTVPAGRCNGYVTIRAAEGARLAWEVARQPGMCRIGGRTTELSRRTYDCVVTGERFVCDLRVYGADGRQYGETARGVGYARQ